MQVSFFMFFMIYIFLTINSENIIAPSVEEGFKEVKVIEQSSLNETFNKLSKNLIINNLQGYAFYYEAERGKIQ